MCARLETGRAGVRTEDSGAQVRIKQIVIVLSPGDYFVGDAGYRIRTLLGSCVSVALWCPLRRVGAMSHFLLAHRGTPGRIDRYIPATAATSLDARYGDEALVLMLQDLDRQGVAASHVQAKIFGGGEMFPSQRASGALAIGRRNGEAARSMLHARGIEVTSESLFGEGHRQIEFDIATGDVWMRQVRPAHSPSCEATRHGHAP